MRILVCEDNPITLKTISFTLAKAGHEVLKAIDGNQAISAIDSEMIDLLITDINMPYTKGLELVRYINTKLERKIPVIIISGITLNETKEHAMELGAMAYLTKPFDPGDLLKMVKTLSDQ